MLVKNRKHLYNVKNFDNYKNIYAIRANQSKIDNITYEINDGVLRHKYNIIKHELILFFSIDKEIKVNGLYKIIYGHFYNDSNDFLFKKLNNDKIINIDIFRCNRNELVYNELKNFLVYSDSYDNIYEQAINISKEKIYEIKSTFIAPLNILYDSENLILMSNNNSNISFSYENECVSINKKYIN